MEINKRRAINDKLTNYCYMAKKDDYIEITEWTNGEGYDIDINEKKRISLTHGEIDAINHLINCLRYDNDKINTGN